MRSLWPTADQWSRYLLPFGLGVQPGRPIVDHLALTGAGIFGHSVCVISGPLDKRHQRLLASEVDAEVRAMFVEGDSIYVCTNLGWRAVRVRP